ncbi:MULTISPECIES: HNH endonuclease signature motif containing protein [Nitratireductor]|uniref:HNH endonuclease signature motif containing protein n=1 Tax=Nitratireductor TaxID=245876 RepID=UPI001FDEE529|nr:HNH endonuclease signature motif containing protein [Nitratireductor sp. OM-1]
MTSKTDTGSRRDAIRERIRARVVEAPAPDWMPADLGPCLLWTGPTSGDGRGGGYPRMSLNGQTVAVHIVNWTNEHGYVPGKKQLDHLCRNRLCISDRHLDLVTPKQNQRRKVEARSLNRHNGGPPLRDECN